MEWNKLDNTLINISLLLLLVNLILYWTNISFPKLSSLKQWSKLQLIIINIGLAVILGKRWNTYGYFPLSNLYESLIFLTWCLTFVQICIEYKIKSQLVGAISTPVEIFIIAFAHLSLPKEMQQASPLVPALHSNWLMMHVTVMLLSYGLLIIGSLLSILFLVIAQKQSIIIRGNSTGYIGASNQERFININSSGNTSVTNKVNLLENIDNLSYRIIGIGFPLLTIGIISGAVWANEAWGSYWSWDPKETWALITWIVFASYLHSRLTKLWTGKKPAMIASLGFFVVWVCYLGVNFLGQGLHSYGWFS
uniref:Cytochrome c biogenesis protein CcsA n=1 Tax=Yamadaella caenomyce TaxID=259029 RepID=A0A1G4NYN2_9FLOR|nr:Cytochrome c biogenesis protein ccs1 [Yamadaella caenomyce]SCW23758.1 Cytochrome c biogenesis protein ccs1 [Yamadaella caenomyce]